MLKTFPKLLGKKSEEVWKGFEKGVEKLVANTNRVKQKKIQSIQTLQLLAEVEKDKERGFPIWDQSKGEVVANPYVPIEFQTKKVAEKVSKTAEQKQTSRGVKGVGLKNHGFTCYAASALQFIRKSTDREVIKRAVNGLKNAPSAENAAEKKARELRLRLGQELLELMEKMDDYELNVSKTGSKSCPEKSKMGSKFDSSD